MRGTIRVGERHSCLLCGNRGLTLYTDLQDRMRIAPGTWALMQCPKDSLVWLNPQPVPEDIEELYPKYYTHTVVDPEPPRLARLRKAIKQGILASAFGYDDWAEGKTDRALGWVCSRIGPLREAVGGMVMWLDASWRGRLLDVGCGNGSHVAPLADLGWDVSGIEPDAIPAQIAREHFGLKVHEGTLEDAHLSAESFDAITMHHVIEHLPDPLSTLRECWRLLKPGGKLVIITPNWGSLACRIFGSALSYLDPPRHLTLFSRDSLASCAETTGFRVVDMHTTERNAWGVWIDSRSIHRDGVLPEGWPQRQKPVSILEGLAFLAIEGALKIIMKDVGEELVLVAARPPGLRFEEAVLTP